MKWYSSDIKPEPEKWIIYCWKNGNSLSFHVEKTNIYYPPHDCWCWAYLDIEDFLNSKIVQKSDLPQYTGKRLISI